MISDQDVREASIQSSTNSGNICRTSSCNKNHLCAFFSDFLFQTRNSITCEVVWRWVQQVINAAPFCIQNPMVDIHNRMEILLRNDPFPPEDSLYNQLLNRMVGPRATPG